MCGRYNIRIVLRSMINCLILLGLWALMSTLKPLSNSLWPGKVRDVVGVTDDPRVLILVVRHPIRYLVRDLLLAIWRRLHARPTHSRQTGWPRVRFFPLDVLSFAQSSMLLLFCTSNTCNEVRTADIQAYIKYRACKGILTVVMTGTETPNKSNSLVHVRWNAMIGTFRAKSLL